MAGFSYYTPEQLERWTGIPAVREILAAHKRAGQPFAVAWERAMGCEDLDDADRQALRAHWAVWERAYRGEEATEADLAVGRTFDALGGHDWQSLGPRESFAAEPSRRAAGEE